MSGIKKLQNGLAKDFKTTITKLEQDLKAAADNNNIIAGTKEKPIVNDNPNIPIQHFFMDGVYIREMTMFEGTVVIGAIHKTLHMCFLLKGSLTGAVVNGVKFYIAPCKIIATPGVKRVLYANEDSVWYNTHKNPSNTRDVNKLEEDLVALSYKEYEKYINKNK